MRPSGAGSVRASPGLCWLGLGGSAGPAFLEKIKVEDVIFVCGISLTSGQLINELFPDCTRSCFSQVLLRHKGSDLIYEMNCLFVAVGVNALFIVMPHWDKMS